MYHSSQGYGIGSGSGESGAGSGSALAPESIPYFHQQNHQESRLEYIAHSEISPLHSASSAHTSPPVTPYTPSIPGRVVSYGVGQGVGAPGGLSNYNLFSSPCSGGGGYSMGGNGHSSGSYNASSGQYSFQIIKPEYHFDPALFLRPGKEGGFVGKAEEVREFVETAFEKIFQASFPDDIKISVLPMEEFRKLAPQPGVIGLSLNRKKEGLLNEIFILNDSLARVMLTIGHELGHVLTETLNNPHDEEAKAYAFSLEWMRIIKKNDIASLGDAIVTERPAENGLHNVAFSFVEKMLLTGKQAWNVYLELVKGFLNVEPEVVPSNNY